MLHTINYDVLTQLANEHGLSEEQKEVFLRRFGLNKSYEEIAEELQTSPSACLKRMSLVYEKFDIQGRGKGKESRLRRHLVEASKTYEQERILNETAIAAESNVEEQSSNNSLKEFLSLCRDAEAVQSDLSRCNEATPKLGEVFGELLLKRFLDLLPGAINATHKDKAQLTIELITEVRRHLVS